MHQFICAGPECLPEPLRRRLTFLSRLSGGAHREVYLARDGETGGKVILKWTGPGGSDSARREYALLSKLSHPAIPSALHFEVGEDGAEYLVRSYAEGATLSLLVERDGAFTTRQALEIARKLAGVLGYLHSQRPPIVYKDIKPQNIVLTPNGKLSLIDFGIARENRTQRDADTRLIGSFPYASPEHLGFQSTDARSDIFSLGRLMNYLTTGDAQTALTGERGFGRIVRKCTRLSPEKRYASVGRLARAIDRALNPPSRSEMGLGIAAASVLVLLASVWMMQSAPQQAAPVSTAPILANGQGDGSEVLIPVAIRVTRGGAPASDCAVSIDNHHWYEPTKGAEALLRALPRDACTISAASGNQIVSETAPILLIDRDYAFALDLNDAPVAPELIELSLAFGERHDVSLNIENAQSVTLSGQPAGIVIERRGEGWTLLVDPSVETPGFYALPFTCESRRGKASGHIALNLDDPKSVMLIRTAEDMDGVRNDLSGRYELAEDIDLSALAPWTPIGDIDYPFTGSIDGRGHRVTGLAQECTTNTGLFGVTRNAQIRGIVLDAPEVRTIHTGYGGTGGVVGVQNGGIVERCAVLDGRISGDISYESGAGGVIGINQGGIARDLFNSASVTIAISDFRASSDSFAGGIVGVNTGYLAGSGNAGPVKGASMAGGVTAFCDKGTVTRCYNAGSVTAQPYMGTHPAGGIAQLLGRGIRISDCAFQKDTAPVGATVWNGGALINLEALEPEGMRDIEALQRALNAGQGWEGLIIAPDISQIPIPEGIF